MCANTNTISYIHPTRSIRIPTGGGERSNDEHTSRLTMLGRMTASRPSLYTGIWIVMSGYVRARAGAMALKN